MSRTIVLITLAGGLTLSTAAPATASAAPDSAVETRLADGQRLVEEGRFAVAVPILSLAVQQLEAAADDADADQLARAYLYLGWAYVGLGKIEEAKARFLDALARDEGVELSASEFPRKVREAFELARAEAERAGDDDTGHHRRTLLWVGLGGGAAAGIAAATIGGSSTEPCAPAQSIAVDVPATRASVATGLQLASGKCFRIAASGVVRIDPDFSFNGPAGRGVAAANTAALTYPLPGQPLAGLVARVGGGPWVFVGASFEGRADGDGELLLMINDAFEGLDNNAGSFDVRVDY